MKTISNIIVIVLTSIILIGCEKDSNNRPCIKGKGARSTQIFRITDFSGVELRLDAEVEIKQGNEFKIEVSGYQNQIDELDLKVKNNILEIASDRCFKNEKFGFIVTMPTVNSVILSGSGKIVVPQLMDEDLIYFRISGSGNITAEVASKKINASVQGSGNLILRGTTNEFNAEIAGSGNIKALSMNSDNLKVSISGSGYIENAVNLSIDASISGSGEVRYRGNPAVDSSISGSGRVRKIP